jgi:hypothetical protein
MRIGYRLQELSFGRVSVFGAIVLTVASLAPRSGVCAEALETLYSFCAQGGCADGNEPDAHLIADASGNLYGTTELDGAHGNFRTVFALTP